MILRAAVLALGAIVVGAYVHVVSVHLDRWNAERAFLQRSADNLVYRTVGASDEARIATLMGAIDRQLTRSRNDTGILRASARQSWLSRRGDCATAARIAVLVLDRLGIEAQRLVVAGHTAIAWKDGDNVWRAGIGIRPPPRWVEIAESSPRLADLPVPYSFWNWERLTGLDVRTTQPWPRWTVILLESPDLMRALIWGIATLVVVPAFLIVGWKIVSCGPSAKNPIDGPNRKAAYLTAK